MQSSCFIWSKELSAEGTVSNVRSNLLQPICLYGGVAPNISGTVQTLVICIIMQDHLVTMVTHVHQCLCEGIFQPPRSERKKELNRCVLSLPLSPCVLAVPQLKVSEMCIPIHNVNFFKRITPLNLLMSFS